MTGKIEAEISIGDYFESVIFNIHETKMVNDCVDAMSVADYEYIVELNHGVQLSKNALEKILDDDEIELVNVGCRDAYVQIGVNIT